MTDREHKRIHDSWEQYNRDGSTVRHLRRVLYPSSTRKRVDWFLVFWMVVLGSCGALLGTWLVAR